jgi:hypothetical protein
LCLSRYEFAKKFS